MREGEEREWGEETLFLLSHDERKLEGKRGQNK